jgi:hypothetical protein
VEHGITELVNGGVDLVEWMLRLQLPGMEPLDLDTITTERSGHSIEVRDERSRYQGAVYAPPTIPLATRLLVQLTTRECSHEACEIDAIAQGPAHQPDRSSAQLPWRALPGTYQRGEPCEGLPALPRYPGRGGLPIW